MFKEPLLRRWVWSPYDATTKLPHCAQYAQQWRVPDYTAGGSCLVLVLCRPGDLVRMLADSALKVCDSLHCQAQIPAAIYSALSAAYPGANLAATDTVAQGLHKLGVAVHPVFHPET